MCDYFLAGGSTGWGYVEPCGLYGWWDVERADPGLIILFSNVSWISVDEVVYEFHLSKHGRRVILQPEQKIVSLMKDFVHNFSEPGDYVLHRFAKTLATREE